VLLYGNSRGSLRLVDLRERALCATHFQQYQHAPHPLAASFTDCITSINDAKFVANGSLIVARDYLTLKVWDPRQPARPFVGVMVQDMLVPYLQELYDNDCIFDKFRCSPNAQGTCFLTGSYHNHFLVHDAVAGESTTIEAKDDTYDGSNAVAVNLREAKVENDFDFSKKVLHVSWHPGNDVLAVAAMNKIYIYQAARSMTIQPDQERRGSAKPAK
jgi:serine/threonine-protein phosphatase 2A regulatory subunit B